MSILDFGKTLLTTVFTKARASKELNVIKDSAEDFRKVLEKKENTNFLVTKSNVSQMLRAIGSIDPNLVNTIYLKIIELAGSKGLKYKMDTVAPGVIIIKQIEMGRGPGGILTLLKKAFEGIENSGQLTTIFQQGHVYGVATKAVGLSITRLESRLEKAREFGPVEDLGTILFVLEELHKKLSADDLASSNSTILNSEAYAKYTDKTSNGMLVEMQFRSTNAASGGGVSSTFQTMREFFTPTTRLDTTLANRFNPIKGEGINDRLFKALILAKGSPSLIDLIHDDIVFAFTGKKPSTKKYNIPLTKIKETKTTIKAVKDKQGIKKRIVEVAKAIAIVKKEQIKRKAIRNNKGQFTNLTSLQVLLNTKLAEQISNNMGDGERRDILNYRTGRFAMSANVEGLTQSREGMINVFYTYMKYPYQTFEPGFKQGSPKTRDPKLLIGRSIREIGATIVSNRMRTILV